MFVVTKIKFIVIDKFSSFYLEVFSAEMYELKLIIMETKTNKNKKSFLKLAP